LLKIEDFQRLCRDTRSIAVTKHARIRLTERDITTDDIEHAIQTGEIIKQYEDAKPFPCCLILGETAKNKYLHAVASIDDEILYIITAYYPDENEWETDFKTRKGQKK
jgi:hypothetical protein